jgi:hypothetical protein
LNQYGFILGSFVGLLSLTALNIYSKRVVKQIFLHKSGKEVTVKFMSALWKPREGVYSIREFGDCSPSYGNFHRAEIVSLGNIWLLKESSIYVKDKQIQDILQNILDGKSMVIADNTVIMGRRVK